MLEKESDKAEFSKALKIGALCIVTYTASYIMRNVLSVSSVQMLKDGFTKDKIGSISSIYFMAYAFGQLVNGRLGDKVKAKNMVVTGLFMSGFAAICFLLVKNLYMQIVVFALNGFGLSMLRGPLVKMISENTIPKHARNICIGFSAAGLCGPLFAGMLAAVLNWRYVFFSVAAITVIMGILSFALLSFYERKGVIADISKDDKKEKTSYFKMFLIDKFLMYLFVGALTETVSSSVVFWIPAYLAENLGFSASQASLIYSVISVIRSVCPFLCIFIFNLIKNKDRLLIGTLFFAACVFFALMNFASNRWVNISSAVLALVCVGCVSSTLWSFFIPSLGKYGCVSSANGLFDFAGYIAASAANMFFATAVTKFGWTRLTYIWSALMLSGVLVVLLCGVLPLKKVRKV